MTYAEIQAAHVAGNPPGADPQRSNETFADYKLRMNAIGLQPDITASATGDYEADANYEARLATYTFPQDAAATTDIAVYGANVVGAVATATSATSATTATTANTASYISSSATFDAGKTYNLSASYAP